MDDKLILAVFNYPELYNVTLPIYRCTESRLNAWRSISVLLGLPSEECKRKWKNMRDRYLKEVRLEIKNKNQSRWKYRQLMNFIAPFTGSRSGMCVVNGDHEFPDESSTAAAATEADISPKIPQEMAAAKTPQTCKSGRKRRSLQESLELSCSQSAPYPTKWQVEDAAAPNRPPDEDELFMLSFVPAMKRLTPQKRCETKIKIQQIMYQAEFNAGFQEN